MYVIRVHACMCAGVNEALSRSYRQVLSLKKTPRRQYCTFYSLSKRRVSRLKKSRRTCRQQIIARHKIALLLQGTDFFLRVGLVQKIYPELKSVTNTSKTKIILIAFELISIFALNKHLNRHTEKRNKQKLIYTPLTCSRRRLICLNMRSPQKATSL